MELGYNTDVLFAGEPYHVQTEGHVGTSARIDTLVYKRGVILHKLSVPDPTLSLEAQAIEETKRKIRQQHLTAVSYVQRGEIGKLDRIKDMVELQDSFAGLDEQARAHFRRLWKSGARTLAEQLLLLARAKIVEEDDLPPLEEKLLHDGVAHFIAVLGDEEIPFYRKQSLVSTLLMADASGKLLDRYKSLVAEEGASFPPLDELSSRLRGAAGQLIEILFQQSRKGSALADDFLLHIFTRQSLDLVKFLFQEAEKRFTAAGQGDRVHRNILPVVLLILEDKFLREPPPEAEIQDILDRLNYLYARLDIDTFRQLGAEVARLRGESARASPFNDAQRRTVEVYKERLQATVKDIKAAATLPEKLAVVNRTRDEIVSWERLLMLDVDLRLALKMYHNGVTELLTNRAQALGAELSDVLTRRPSRGVRCLLQALDAAIRDRENIGRIVGRALLAEGLLSTLKKHDLDRTMSKSDIKRELERLTRSPRPSMALLAEIGQMRLGPREQLAVARRLLEGFRLTRELKEELEALVLSRYPQEVLQTAAEKLREAGGPPPVAIVGRLEDAIEAEDGAWLSHGGESGFEPEFEVGLEAATLQRLVFPGRTDAARLLDQALTAAGFSFAEVKNRGGKPAFVLRYRLQLGRAKEEPAAPRGEALMKSQKDGRAREVLRSFEREIKGMSANLEIRVAQLAKVADDLARVPAAIDALRSHYRPLIASNRRLQEKLQSFETVVKGIVDPLLEAAKKAQSKGGEIAPLILSHMASDDKRRELSELLVRFFSHEMTVGIGAYTKLRDDLQDAFEHTLPHGTPEWDLIDLPRFQVQLVSKNLPQAQVALAIALLYVNDRFFVDLKPRKAFRCRVDKLERAVESGLY